MSHRYLPTIQELYVFISQHSSYLLLETGAGQHDVWEVYTIVNGDIYVNITDTEQRDDSPGYYHPLYYKLNNENLYNHLELIKEYNKRTHDDASRESILYIKNLFE
jgi:hypothetical protein